MSRDDYLRVSGRRPLGHVNVLSPDLEVGQGTEPVGLSPKEIIPVQTSYVRAENIGLNYIPSGTIPWFNAFWFDYSSQDRRNTKEQNFPQNMGSNREWSANYETVFLSPLNWGFKKLGNFISKLTDNEVDKGPVMGTMVLGLSYFSIDHSRVQPTAWDLGEKSNGYKLRIGNTLRGPVAVNVSLTQKVGTISPFADCDYLFRSSMWEMAGSYNAFSGQYKFNAEIGVAGGPYEQTSTSGRANIGTSNPYRPSLPSFGSSSSGPESGYDIWAWNWNRRMNMGLEYGGDVLGMNGISGSFSAAQQKYGRWGVQSNFNFGLGFGIGKSHVDLGYGIYDDFVPPYATFETGEKNRSTKYDLGVKLPLTGHGALSSLKGSPIDTSLVAKGWRMQGGTISSPISGVSVAVKASFGNLEKVSILGWKPFNHTPTSREEEAVNQLVSSTRNYVPAKLSPENAGVLWNYYYQNVVIERALRRMYNSDGSTFRAPIPEERVFGNGKSGNK